MSETDFTVDSALPRITAVSAHEGFAVTVTWDDGKTDVVDLAPAVFRYKVYAPLRAEARLFSSIHVADDGFAIAWGDDEIDMASTTIEDLAGQVMTAADFSAFMKRHNYTLDGVAAELGISRRLAAYYQRGRLIPRYIAFACAHLDTQETSTRELLPAVAQMPSNGVFPPQSDGRTLLNAACPALFSAPSDINGNFTFNWTPKVGPNELVIRLAKLGYGIALEPASAQVRARPVFHGGGEPAPRKTRP